MSLPIFKSDSKEVDMMQTQWASQLNPILTNPFLQGRLLKSVVLASGANVVNHGLGRKLQGWVPVRLRASATLYDVQDLNASPALTLNLIASTAVTVDLYVF